MEGLRKLVAIKASLNRGLTPALYAAFPYIILFPRPSVLFSTQYIKYSYWLAGFTSGDGYFTVRVLDSSTHRLGYRVQLVFKLTLDIKDEHVLISLAVYLEGGDIVDVSGTVAEY